MMGLDELITSRGYAEHATNVHVNTSAHFNVRCFEPYAPCRVDCNFSPRGPQGEVKPQF